jgi:hypothetical protein
MHDRTVITPCDFRRDDDAWLCGVCGRRVRLQSEKPPVAVCRMSQGYGAASKKPTRRPLPGDELAAILRDWLGIEAESGCGCKSMASRMNALGPDWCESEAGLAEILGVMRTEHAKRLADGRARLPWTDFGATQLVKLACRRARAKAAS